MQAKTGTLNIHTENIFPIIKKFLYSNQEVFLRELVSNAVDATQKVKTLASVGELQADLGETTIRINIDSEAGTLTISDAGIGMTADEVEQYINQIAFSSAEEFLGKYKDKGAQIIGHFGLGFYSAFMVADRVELITRSYRDGAQAVRWFCDGSTTFEISTAERVGRGTDVILHIGEEHKAYLDKHRIQEILNKHCRYLPIEIEFDGKVINDTHPIWRKKPNELTDEDYLKFYEGLFPFSEKPLFWIHLNVDYPFTLTGVLYFPKITPKVEIQKNKIQLYSNQVFITDDVRDIVPEYLTLLHGVIDSPDIPLNVSRSYLQTDAQVRKISNHIAKKVADKLVELFQDNRSDYEGKWASLNVFVKYGMLRDDTFYDRVRRGCLLETTEGKFYTLDEYREQVAVQQTDKNGKVVYLYTTDAEAQHAYVQRAQQRGYSVLLLDGVIDSHFIQHMELKLEQVQFTRVDAGSLDKMIDKGVEKTGLLNETEQKELQSLYEQVVANPQAKVEFQALGEEELPVVITRPEHSRRLQEMMQQQGMAGLGALPDQYSVVLNSTHPLAKKILLQSDATKRQQLARHSYDLARLQQGMLTGPSLSAFVQDSLALL